MMYLKTNEKGISLLELMLAIAVFVVGSATVAHLFLGAQSAADYSADKTQALLLVREGIEEKRMIRDQNFDDLLDEEGTELETINLDGKDFEREIELYCPHEDECKVESTVEWTSFNRSESVRLTEHLMGWMEGEYEENNE